MGLQGDPAEFILWERASVLWDGKDYSIEIEVYVDGVRGRWLDWALEDLLRQVPGLDFESVDVEPGVRCSPPASGWETEGAIRIRGVALPWPKADDLHEAMRRAMRDADQAAAQAERDAADFIAALRAPGDRNAA